MLLLCLGLISTSVSSATAKLSRVEDLQTAPYAGRADYELVSGRAVVTFDPNLRGNRQIVDIAHAERDSEGFVEATANLVVIRPREAARSNGNLLFEVSNRSGEYVSMMFNEGPGAGLPGSRPATGS